MAVENLTRDEAAQRSRLLSVSSYDVHLDGIFVHCIVHVPEHENAFEFKTLRKR